MGRAYSLMLRIPIEDLPSLWCSVCYIIHLWPWPPCYLCLCEARYPETNTLHTVSGEMSISLWDLYKLSGLAIYGKIYDEAVPSRDALYQCHQNNQRLMQPTCRYLFVAYSHLENAHGRGVCAERWIDFWCTWQVKRESFPRRRSSSKSHLIKSHPKSTHNSSGDIQPMTLQWTQEESTIFDALVVPKIEEGILIWLLFFPASCALLLSLKMKKDSFVLAPLKWLATW